MSLEDYKKEALNYHKKQYPIFTEALENLQQMSNEDWEEYMKDFSPKVFIAGSISGLI